MAHDHLPTYLNDHLAGATMALELLEHLERAYAGESVEQFLADLRRDVEADERRLRELMERLGISASKTRQATAWMAEKATRLKLRLDDLKHGEFRLFEALEGLSLGIEGKAALWTALGAAAENVPSLQQLDYEDLIARAEDQLDRVEQKRLDLAPPHPRAELGAGLEPRKGGWHLSRKGASPLLRVRLRVRSYCAELVPAGAGSTRRIPPGFASTTR